MSFYTQEVVLKPLPDGRWELMSPLRWEIGKKDSGHVYEVKPGFETDLASIPWWGRWAIDRGDARLAKAAILHDSMHNDGEYSPITASAEFTAALLADGCKKWWAIIMGLAVLVNNA